MTDYAPWWQIVWRCLWFLPFQLLRVAMALVTLVGWGRRTARQFWYDTL